MRIDCVQRSEEWMSLRTAKVGASSVAATMSFLKRASKGAEKGEESQARKDYKARIVVETLTGLCQENYVSPAMEWGIQQEPFARALYEVQHDASVEQVGLFIHPQILRACASPDGLLGDDGLIEIKCPNSTTHLDYIINAVVPAEYQPQMLWQMACTGRQWCEFVSFDPRMPDYLQLFVVRFQRDEARICEMEKAVEQFLLEVDDMLARLPQNDSPEAIIKQAEAEIVAKQVEEDMLLITKEDVCRHS